MPSVAFAQEPDTKAPSSEPASTAETNDTGSAAADTSDAVEKTDGAATDAGSLAANADGAIADADSLTAEANQAAVSYDYDAKPYSPATGSAGTTADADGVFPGVYTTKVTHNGDNAEVTDKNPETIGISSIADATLADAPTTESPAIIQGAAVGYEEKTGPTEYTQIKDRDAPYDYFRYSILEETAQDGTVHKKLSGFDGTYVIVRIDVADLFNSGKGAYLHVKQDDNRALLVAVGMTNNTFVGTLTTVPEGETAYKAGGVYKTGSYKLSDMYDATGADTKTPYLDVVLFATAANVAGADAGKADALNGDVPLSFYVDDKATYNDVVYDPQSTDPNHIFNCLEKFYDSVAAAASSVSHYLVKGSDLALETMVENTGGQDGTATTYWSLEKSLQKPFYDQEIDKSADDPGCGRTVTLMSEVAITDEMKLAGTSADNLKKRTLNVNSFDVQVAKNTQSTNTGFTLENAWLTLEDKSATTGAELAIGNNARFTINRGGRFIIDETAQLEIEWDGGTTAAGQPSDTLNNGVLDLNAGGEVVNNGVITIEGTEGKPYQPGQQVDPAKGYGEMTIEPGATLTNNGAFVVYGKLFNLGTLVNNGRYDDTIVSNDPDQGLFEYHHGIQVSWKDDVTQPNVTMGELLNGIDRNGTIIMEAVLRNLGDILLAPGKIVNYGTIVNEEGANIYLAAGEEAIIPIEPTPEAPTVVSKRITLDPPVASVIENHGTIINNGRIMPASVEIRDNTSFGKLTVPGNHPELFNLVNDGTIINNGYIWGWDTGKKSYTPAQLPATGDTLAAWMFLALIVTALASMGLILARRFRKQ